MSAFETVLYEVDGVVATITLNRPQALNACNRTLRRELLAAITQANADASIRVVVLTGKGRAFCTGQDLSETMPEHSLPQFQVEDEFKPALLAIAHAPKPYVAALNGVTAGGGCGFALACDIVFMAEDAFIFPAFLGIGFVPDAGLSWHLLHNVGPKKAYELIASGERWSAQKCVELGLANRAVPAVSLLDEVQRYAQQLATQAPLSLRYTKQLLRDVATMDLAQAISHEAATQNRLVLSEDGREGVAAFREKRKPDFKGR